MSLGSPIFLVLPREALERSFVMTDYSIPWTQSADTTSQATTVACSVVQVTGIRSLA